MQRGWSFCRLTEQFGQGKRGRGGNQAGGAATHRLPACKGRLLLLVLLLVHPTAICRWDRGRRAGEEAGNRQARAPRTCSGAAHAPEAGTAPSCC